MKRIFFAYFKEKIEKIRIIRNKYVEFENSRDNILKFKAFLGLEKNYTTNIYIKKYDSRKYLTLNKKSFDSLRFNVFIRKISEKFQCIKRTINIMVYMKELKLNSGYSKYFRSLKNKAFHKYFKTQSAKALKILKINSIIRKRENNRCQEKFSSAMNKKKLEAINLFGKISAKIYDSSSSNLKIESKNKKSAIKPFFSKWRDYTNLKSKEIAFNFLIKKIYFKILLNRINRIKCVDNSLVYKTKSLHRKFFKKFIALVKKKILVKFQTRKFHFTKVRDIHYKSLINGMIKSSNDNPKYKYVSK